MLDFLLPESEVAPEPVHIPTEGFATTGFVAEWQGKILYSFMVDLEVPAGTESAVHGANYIAYLNAALADVDERIPEPVASQKLGDSGWSKHWYEKDANARQATEMLQKHEGLDRRPGVATVWRFEARAETCLNLSPAAQDAFGEILAWETRISTLGSIYRRHEYHMISLPSAIAVAATALGFNHPGFSLEELTEPDIVYTGAFQTRMIGTAPEETEDGKYKHVNALGGYADSILWQQRVALWAALGEQNPKAFRRMGTGSKYDTSSDKLHKCLAIVETPWTRPTWALLVPVRDPRLDAVSKSGTRLGIPCLTALYRDRVTAEEAAKELTGEDSTITATATSSGKSLPATWAGNEANWMEHVAIVQAKLQGPPIPANVKQAIIDAFGSLENVGIGKGVEIQDYIDWMA